jgi:hypothetical protein
MKFSDLVEGELEKAREKHTTKMYSAHEAFAVIFEELDEFWDEVRKKRPDQVALLKELVQTAAMCQRAAEDIGLMEHYEAINND